MDGWFYHMGDVKNVWALSVILPTTPLFGDYCGLGGNRRGHTDGGGGCRFPPPFIQEKKDYTVSSYSRIIWGQINLGNKSMILRKVRQERIILPMSFILSLVHLCQKSSESLAIFQKNIKSIEKILLHIPEKWHKCKHIKQVRPQEETGFFPSAGIHCILKIFKIHRDIQLCKIQSLIQVDPLGLQGFTTGQGTNVPLPRGNLQ